MGFLRLRTTGSKKVSIRTASSGTCVSVEKLLHERIKTPIE